ncbi:MAG: hypothetical protein QGG53_20605 [Planctomycetota bacterium]|nr:hypothetical protein [Planctomycetota bacterium]
MAGASTKIPSVVSVAFLVALIIALGTPGFAHESPVDHVERTLRMWVKDGRLHLSYRIELTERSVLIQLHRMDRDGNGRISQSEKAEYFTPFREALAGQLEITIGERRLPMRPDGDVKLSPGLRQTYTFSSPLPAAQDGKVSGRLRDLYSARHPGTYRYVPKQNSGLKVSAPSGLKKTGDHSEIVLSFVVQK